MSGRTLVLSLIGAGCVTAAGAGSFYAVRVNSDESPAMAAATPVAATDVATVEAPRAADPVPAASPWPAPASNMAPAPAPRPVSAPRIADRRPADVERPASSAPASTPAPATASASAPPKSVDPVATDPANVAPPIESTATPAAPRPQYDEITIKEDSVIGIQLETALSSDTAKIEDKVVARVSRDLTLDGRTAIPSGARLEGNVTAVDRGGKFKERARLGVRFTTLVLGESMRVPIQTETIFRVGDSPAPEATAKIGASAVVGSILGAVIGGKKGAAIGSAAGAAGGTAAVAASGRNDVRLQPGTPLTVRLVAPVTFLIERLQ
jgi:hypothetical protein